MKNYLLYFFALILCLTLLPFTPKFFPLSEEQQPELIHILESETGEIKTIPLEDYVIGVLDAANYPYEGEALKAIAIAVRSSAVYCEQHTPVHPGAAACDDPSCCAACSFDTFSEKAVEAAAETAGLVVTYQGEAAAALTHESSGAYTESSQTVYGISLPYLTEVKNIQEDRITERAWSEAEFLSLIGAPENSDPGDLVLAYDVAERVREMRFGTLSLSGEQLAERLSLPSCCFTLEQREGAIYAICQGAGNGVGMSRNGAALLAESGKTCTEILAFYYPETEICRIS